MQRYLIRRILQMIPLLIGLSILIFFIMYLMPGDPIDMLVMGNPNLKAEDVARLKKVWGFDQPFPVRYYKWLKQAVLYGDLGFSYHWKIPVTQVVGERLPNTLILMSASLVLSLLIAVPLGIYSARRQYSFADYFLTVLAFIGQAMPTFWFGLMMILLFSIYLKTPSGGPLLPPGGMMDIGSTASFFSWDRLKYLIMPAFVLGLHNITSWMRFIRSTMLEVINQDYIRTARAKGLKERTVIYKHAFRNAMIPMITLLAMSIPSLVGGATLTETVFAWNGIGRMTYDSVMNKDYSVAMASLMFSAIMVVFGNLLADILYAVVDPRVRYD